MRVVIDTNILISALISTGTPPQQLATAWRDEKVTVLTSLEQIAEFEAVIMRPRLRKYLRSEGDVDSLRRQLREEAVLVTDPPHVDLSPDPDDNRILAIAIAGKADVLVTGDKGDLLSLDVTGGVRIVTARQAVAMLESDDQ